MRVNNSSVTVHVNHRFDDALHASRITDTETVAEVFISRHTHDMIEMRNRRFLAAAVDAFILPPVACLPVFAILVTTPILNHDIFKKKRGCASCYLFFNKAVVVERNSYQFSEMTLLQLPYTETRTNAKTRSGRQECEDKNKDKDKEKEKDTDTDKD